MRKLVITRKKSFIGCLTVVQVLCDGNVIGSLRSGGKAEMEISEDKHTIYCIVDVSGDGGSQRMTSDVINIQAGSFNINMCLSFGFTLKLTLV